MSWTKPTFEEIKMDAEIGSYQEDREEDREPTCAEAAALGWSLPQDRSARSAR